MQEAGPLRCDQCGTVISAESDTAPAYRITIQCLPLGVSEQIDACRSCGAEALERYRQDWQWSQAGSVAVAPGVHELEAAADRKMGITGLQIEGRVESDDD